MEDSINKDLLIGIATIQKFSREDLSSNLKISYVSFCNKLNGKQDFTRLEIKKIKNLLELTDEQIIKIFF